MATAGTGHGIIGMRERVHLCGGTFSAGPLPDGGFQVTATLPLPAADVRTWAGPRAGDGIGSGASLRAAAASAPRRPRGGPLTAAAGSRATADGSTPASGERHSTR